MNTVQEPPTYKRGKICYIEIPAADVAQSAAFYETVFGWQIRRRDDGSTAFDDTANEVSGTWVLDRPPSTAPGLLTYVMVADAAETVNAIVVAGGEIVRPIDPNAREVFAHFRDPAGNVLGIYQQRGLDRVETKPSAANSWSFAPYLHVDDAAAAIDWYVRVLGAVERERYEMGDGTIGHAELDVHGNMLCLADCRTGIPAPEHYDQVPISLYAVVPDVDAIFNRAVEAGARVDRPLADQTYGHRNGGFVDPFGHVWYVSTPIGAAAP